MCRIRFVCFVSLFAFLWMILPSCTNKPVDEEPTTIPSYLMDRSWLTGEPCMAPCWYGLEPGKSTKEEAISTIKGLPFINPESMVEQDTNFWDITKSEDVPGQTVWFDYKEPYNHTCVYFNIKGGTIFRIYLFPNYKITFQQAVEEIGAPDFLMYRKENPEGKGCYAKLLWVVQQMELMYSERRRNFWEKDLCDRIEEANNKIPTDLLIHHVLIMGKEWMEETAPGENFIPWNGFITNPP